MNGSLDSLKQYIGAIEIATDVVTASAVAKLAATLGIVAPGSAAGDRLPPGWHAPFFGPLYGPDTMRADGQAAGGGIVPPVPLPKRRLRGERTVFHDALRIGDELTRASEIADLAILGTSEAPEVSLMLRQTIESPRGPAVVEEREFSYLGESAADNAPGKPPAAARDAPWRRTIDADPVLLFRYSAVRFNGHRIHYDRDYATRIEGCPGLVVHGTLIWQLMLEMCRAGAPGRPVAELRYRTHKPVYDIGPFTLAGRPSEDGATAELWAIDQDGLLATEATARFAA